MILIMNGLKNRSTAGTRAQKPPQALHLINTLRVQFTNLSGDLREPSIGSAKVSFLTVPRTA